MLTKIIIMKKFILSLWLTMSMLFPGTLTFSQNHADPFAVKKKSGISKANFQPAPLTNKNLVTRQSPAVASFSVKTTPFKVPLLKTGYHFTKSYYNNNGLLSFVSCKRGEGAAYQSRSSQSMQQAAFVFMNRIKQAMRIHNPQQEFHPVKIWNDDLGFDHVKMQQYYKGVKVYGGQIILHGKNGLINTMNGTYFPTPTIDLTPVFTENAAIKIVKKDVSAISQIVDPHQIKNKLLTFNETESELVVYHFKLNILNEKLVWHITVRPNVLERWEYFVDAGNGHIVNKYNNTCSDGPATANALDLNGITRTLNTYQYSGNYYLINTTKPMFNGGQTSMPDQLVGAIWTIDANNSNSGDFYQVTSGNNTWNDAASVSAHYNADNTYNYYKNTHGRNSIDGNGGTIISIVNVVDENGNSLANAYWNGSAMFYGNGGNMFKPLAGAEDVGAHEMTHGVIQNTANLEYQYESGAINEAMADIGGAMVDRDNWQIGEKIIPQGSPYFPTGTLRDMSNPHNGGSSFNDPSYQPANVNEKYTGEQDNGGVHTNSGIINYAYYKIAEAISKNKAEKLFYRALSVYMTKSSQFIDCRLAFEQAAKDIFGNNST